MNQLACREVDEALAAYAADGLEPGEHVDVASHLAECRNHDAELAELRQTFAGLASAAAPGEPPPSLRASLMEAFDREVGAGAPHLPEPAILRPASPRTRLAPAAWLGYALAAALLVLAAGLGAWGASRGDGGEDIQVITTEDAGGSLRLTYLPQQGLGVIDVELPAVAQGQAYQAWRLDDSGKPVSLGILPAGRGRIALDGDLRGATALALSVEPAGGSVAPTSDPILVTALN
jgi:anti-sigma-K factor RskA